MRVFLQQPHDDLGQLGRQPGISLRRCQRHLGQGVVHHLQRIAHRERRHPGCELVERRAQPVQVGPVVHRHPGPPGLLGRKVGQGPDDLAGMGEPRELLRQGARQIEVDQQGSTLRAADQDVRRVDVPVQHPDPMRRRDNRGQLLSKLHPRRHVGSRIVERVLGDRRGQRHTMLIVEQQGVRGAADHQPGHPRHAAQPAQNPQLMPGPLDGAGAQHLLADQAPVLAGPPQSRDLGALADIQQLTRLPPGAHREVVPDNVRGHAAPLAPPHTAPDLRSTARLKPGSLA